MKLVDKSIEEIKSELKSLDQDGKYDFEIKKHREKRTLTANAYYWSLVNKIANKLKTSKEQVHEIMIKRYSQRQYITVLDYVDIEKFGIVYYDEVRTFTRNGINFKSYIVYERSRGMDRKAFSILVDGIVSEAKEMGIETLPDSELSLLEYLEQERSGE